MINENKRQAISVNIEHWKAKNTLQVIISLLLISTMSALVIKSEAETIANWNFLQTFIAFLIVFWIFAFIFFIQQEKVMDWFLNKNWKIRLAILATNFQPLIVGITFYPDEFGHYAILYIWTILFVTIGTFRKFINVSIWLLSFFVITVFIMIYMTYTNFTMLYFLFMLFGLPSPLVIFRTDYFKMRRELAEKTKTGDS